MSAVFAFAFNSVWVALEIGLLASLVLSTLPNPRSDLVKETLPAYPFTVCTGGAGVNNSIQLDSTVGSACAST